MDSLTCSTRELNLKATPSIPRRQIIITKHIRLQFREAHCARGTLLRPMTRLDVFRYESCPDGDFGHWASPGGDFDPHAGRVLVTEDAKGVP